MTKKQKVATSSKIALLFLNLLIAAGFVWMGFAVLGKRNQLPYLGEPGHTSGPFEFTNQDGKQITERSVMNKVTVIEYFFTSCPSICRRMNENLEAVYRDFKNNSDFMILSHTVDPETDSVPILKAYAKRFDATTPSWQFLTGDKYALYKSANQDYLLSAQDSGASNFIHTQYVALLDKKRHIRGFYDATSPRSIKKIETDINLLLKE